MRGQVNLSGWLGQFAALPTARCMGAVVMMSVLLGSAQVEPGESLNIPSPGDVCEIEIIPEEMDILVMYTYLFYDIYLSEMICEPPSEQYRCKGCRDKNMTFYECFHSTMDPSEPCDTSVRRGHHPVACALGRRGAVL